MSTQPEDIRSFHDLEREVRDQGLCGKCGGCVAFCSAGEFMALRAEKDGTPVLADEQKCLHCGICYLICPQIRALDAELRMSLGWKAPFGQLRGLASARAASPAIRRVATDGGVVTALLGHALKRRMIDAAIVSRRVGPLAREPFIATTPEELLQAAGSHFEESLHVHAVGKSYSSFSPGFRNLRELDKRDLHRIALVGTPCQIFTMRKMQLLKVLPGDSISLMIGLFCMENFTWDAKTRRALERRMGVKLPEIVKLNIKEDIQVTSIRKQTTHIPFEAMDPFARPACMACTDFSNELADISCGGLGSPEGYTTTVVRTAAGERLFNLARRDGVIQQLALRDPRGRKNHYTEAVARIVAFSKRKQRRAAARLEG